MPQTDKLPALEILKTWDVIDVTAWLHKVGIMIITIFCTVTIIRLQ